MKTPVKLTLEGFYQGRARFLRDECVTNSTTGRVCCRKCGTRIKAAPVTIEIHAASNGECVGEGEEFEAGVPYCPACEELPASRGCVHV
jgi:hypothetical protein